MKRWIFAVAIGAVASIIVAGTASADVPRHQPTQTATFTVTQPYGQVGQWGTVWTHNFTVTVNPDDGSFTGTGKQYYPDGTFYRDEMVSGTFTDSSVSLNVERSDGVKWALDNAQFGGKVTLATTNPVVPWDVEMTVTNPVFTDIYKNHGDFVSQNGGGSDNAHSPIGMPLNSNSGK